MLQQLREARKNESGFTLIELLIVIVILGVLAAIVVFSVQGITDRGKHVGVQGRRRDRHHRRRGVLRAERRLPGSHGAHGARRSCTRCRPT